MHLKITSATWRSFRLNLNVLNLIVWYLTLATEEKLLLHQLLFIKTTYINLDPEQPQILQYQGNIYFSLVAQLPGLLIVAPH